MVKKIQFIVVVLFSYMGFAQVGIGTTGPTAALDINGDLRIRTISEEFDVDLAKDSILVISRDGTVKRIPSRIVISSALKTAVKGNFAGGGTVNLNLGVGATYTMLPFNNEDFDFNDEFDTATNTFTAKQDGIYEVSVQINSSSGIAASSNYGVCILKNGLVEAKEDYANVNISVLSINIDVTPTVRKTKTLLQLNAGDTISFQLYSDLSVVDISGNSQDSFFTIVQIR
ncbi:C1q-like domain-containing protein [Winogradskyella ursingii]|uniref:C1q-like domain-containing protein n=1 Tax=Winogradskyella ursingii TaxID=2686079 RepID=UPI0015CD3D8B|nr:hypothetical protein [Winogradskyella ursingii]